jgi:hypothetical protein
MNYQAIRAVLENPLLTAYNGLVPAVPVYFDNIMNDGSDSAKEFVDVNIQFGLTTETALTSNPTFVRGIRRLPGPSSFLIPLQQNRYSV